MKKVFRIHQQAVFASRLLHILKTNILMKHNKYKIFGYCTTVFIWKGFYCHQLEENSKCQSHLYHHEQKSALKYPSTQFQLFDNIFGKKFSPAGVLIGLSKRLGPWDPLEIKALTLTTLMSKCGNIDRRKFPYLCSLYYCFPVYETFNSINSIYLIQLFLV